MLALWTIIDIASLYVLSDFRLLVSGLLGINGYLMLVIMLGLFIVSSFAIFEIAMTEYLERHTPDNDHDLNDLGVDVPPLELQGLRRQDP